VSTNDINAKRILIESALVEYKSLRDEVLAIRTRQTQFAVLAIAGTAALVGSQGFLNLGQQMLATIDLVAAGLVGVITVTWAGGLNFILLIGRHLAAVSSEVRELLGEIHGKPLKHVLGWELQTARNTTKIGRLEWWVAWAPASFEVVALAAIGLSLVGWGWWLISQTPEADRSLTSIGLLVVDVVFAICIAVYYLATLLFWRREATRE
jgi:hypothetical protein